MNKPAFVVTDLDGYRDYSTYPAIAIKKRVEGIFTLLIVDEQGTIHIRDAEHIIGTTGVGLNQFAWVNQGQKLVDRLSTDTVNNRRPLSALLRLMGIDQ